MIWSRGLRAHCAVLLLAVAASASHAQTIIDASGAWRLVENSQPVEADANETLPWLADYRTFRLDHKALKSRLSTAPQEGSLASMRSPHEIVLPMPAGNYERFRIVDTPLMSPELAATWSNIKTYAGVGIDDPSATVRLDYGPNGFHGLVLSEKGTVIIDPIARSNANDYISYFRSDSGRPRSFLCYTADFGDLGLGASAPRRDWNIVPVALSNLKTYRLALNATGEYTVFHGGVTQATAAAVTSVNRVVGVYEKDLSIRMTLVHNKCWPTAGSDPFSNTNGGAMLGQNQSNLDSTVGNANYDIGHVFSTGGGGIAGFRVVGVTGQKAQGVTGQPSPVGDQFDIDYVAHEMGHQFGGNHTFAGTAGSCAGNGASSAAYEPGSGSTIMAYAGICGSQNVQNNSDAYFHTKSFDEIMSWRNNAGSGGTTTGSTNNIPTVEAGANFTIPQGTPFKLTAAGADSDGDPLTYCWEQFDRGTTSTTRPLFRSRLPLTSPTRFFPRLQDVLSGAATPWELLPTVNRPMVFRSTVRDNRLGGSGVAYDSMTVTVSGTAFSVTAPNTNVTWGAGTTQTVTWNVGGGSVAPNVNILLSLDGGNSYGTGAATMLLASTPNDGSQTITVPAVATAQARIIVEGAGNIFFDVSNVNFTITNTAPTVTSISPSSAIAGGAGFTLTVNGSNFTSGDSTVQWNGANLATTFVNSGQLTATVPAANIATAGTASVTVFRTGFGNSNAATFTINNPVPVLGSVTPSSVVAGSGGFTLTANGSGFVNGSVIRWNGNPLATTFVNGGVLTAAVPAGNVASVGSASVTVFNAGPGGGTSAGQTVQITPILVDPSSFQIVAGQSFSATLSMLLASDDVSMRINTSSLSQTPVILDVAGASSATTATRIDFTVETSVGLATSTLSISAWDNVAGAWVVIGTAPASAGDAVRSFSVTTNAARFVNSGNGEVKLRCSYSRGISGSNARWAGTFDQIKWSIHP